MAPARYALGYDGLITLAFLDDTGIEITVNKLNQISLLISIYSANSSPHSTANMRQWIRSVLVQIMACRLFGAKPLSKPMLGYCQLDPQEQSSVKLYANTKHFIHENASETIVCEMAAILSRGRWVKVLCEMKRKKWLWDIDVPKAISGLWGWAWPFCKKEIYQASDKNT